MKRKLMAAMAVISTITIMVSGCGLKNNDVQTANEYVGDEASNEDSAEDDAASVSSIVVMEGLAEPTFEESSASASTSTVDKQVAADEDQTVMVFFGDSQMASGRGDGTDIPSLVSQRVPHSVVYNLGIGGTTAALEASSSSVDPATMNSDSFIGMAYAYSGQADRNAVLASHPEVLETMNKIDPAKVDYYVIEYGANDFFSGNPIDYTQYDGDNRIHAYYDAMCAGVDILKKMSPDAKIIIMTPFYGIYKDTNDAFIGDTYVVSNGYGTLADYAKKAKNVSEDEGCIDFDGMFREHSDLYLDTAEQYLIDGVHLTLTGRQIFARLLAHIPNFYEGYEPYAYLERDNIEIANFDPDEYFRFRHDLMQQYYPEAWAKMQNGEYLLAPPVTQEEIDASSVEAANESAQEQQQQ